MTSVPAALHILYHRCRKIGETRQECQPRRLSPASRNLLKGHSRPSLDTWKYFLPGRVKNGGRVGPCDHFICAEVASAGMPGGPMVCVEWHKESRQRSCGSDSGRLRQEIRLKRPTSAGQWRWTLRRRRRRRRRRRWHHGEFQARRCPTQRTPTTQARRNRTRSRVH